MARCRLSLIVVVISLVGCAEERWGFEAHTGDTPVTFAAGSTKATLAVTVSCAAATLPPEGYSLDLAVTLAGRAPSFGKEYFSSPGRRTDEEPFYVTPGRDFRVPFTFDSRMDQGSPFACDAARSCRAILMMEVDQENEAFDVTARVDASFYGYAPLSPPDDASFAVTIGAP